MYCKASFFITFALFALQASCMRIVRRASFTLANGQQAQALNAQFQTLSADTSCSGDETSCVGGDFAQCMDGEFITRTCDPGTSCFALPLVNSPGTAVACDTEDNAVARIAETGATGGLTGDGF